MAEEGSRPLSSRIGDAMSGWLPDIVEGLKRFPVPAIAAVLTTLEALYSFDSGHFNDFHRQVLAGLYVAFAPSLAAHLYAESRGLTRAVGTAASLALALVFGALGYLGEPWGVTGPMLAGAAMLAVGLAPFVGRPRNNDALWRFNHDLWTDFIAAFGGALLFALGLIAIRETLIYLFGLEIPFFNEWRIFTIALDLVAVWAWLSLLPDDFSGTASFEPTGVPTGDRVTRAVVLVTKFVLAPLLLVYAAILHAYALKIGFTWELPKGHLGWLVSTFGELGTITLLMSYPGRTSSGPIVSLFWRTWFWLLIVPVILLALAIGTRVGQYGLTADRYVVGLLGVWLAGMAAWYLYFDRERDLRVLMASLAVMLLLGGFGPWGAVSTSIASQAARFEKVAKRTGALKDGKLQPASDVAELSAADYDALAASARYLKLHGGTKRLAAFGVPADGDGLEAWLGKVKHTPSALNPPQMRYFGANVPTKFAVAPGGELIGPIYFSGSFGKNEKEAKFNDLGLAVRPAKDGFEVADASGTAAISFETLRRAEADMAAARKNNGRTPIEIDVPMGARHVRVLIDNMSIPSAPLKGDESAFVNLRFWIVR